MALKLESNKTCAYNFLSIVWDKEQAYLSKEGQ